MLAVHTNQPNLGKLPIARHHLVLRTMPIRLIAKLGGLRQCVANSPCSDLASVFRPCALNLKEGSWQVRQAQHPELEALSTIHYGGKTARYLPLPIDPFKATEHQTLAAWFFPSYQAGSASRLAPMTVMESLQALINNGMALVERIDVPGIKTLLKLLSDLPRYSLVYSNLNEASLSRWHQVGTARQCYQQGQQTEHTICFERHGVD